MRSLGAAIVLLFCTLYLAGQSPTANRGATARAAAPIDMTGYWVALVTEDWRYRMLTAPKGDYYSIPLNAEGKRVADTWDGARDVAEGRQCLSYGAPNIMRQPARLHITPENRLVCFCSDHRRSTRSRACKELPSRSGKRRNPFEPTPPRFRPRIPTRPVSGMPAWLRRPRRPTLAAWAGP